MQRVVLDSNLYIGWMNRGEHEALLTGHSLVRYMSAVVHMELRVGATTAGARRAVDQLLRAYGSARRLIAPSAELFDRAGHVLQRLRASGRDVRRGAFVNDVLIALTARALGATLYTADAGDFRAIAKVDSFDLVVVPPDS